MSLRNTSMLYSCKNQQKCSLQSDYVLVYGDRTWVTGTKAEPNQADYGSSLVLQMAFLDIWIDTKVGLSPHKRMICNCPIVLSAYGRHSIRRQ